MQTFTFITADQHRVVVFAISYAHAVGVYALRHETIHGQFPKTLCRDVWRAPEAHSQRHLDAALALQATGVGHYDPQSGWAIRAADDLRASDTER